MSQVFCDGQDVGAGWLPKRASTTPFELKRPEPWTTSRVPAVPLAGLTELRCGPPAVGVGFVVVVVVLRLGAVVVVVELVVEVVVELVLVLVVELVLVAGVEVDVGAGLVVVDPPLELPLPVRDALLDEPVLPPGPEPLAPAGEE